MPRGAEMSVQWHKEYLKRRLALLAVEQANVLKAQNEVSRMRWEVDQYAKQIEQAEADGVEEFDASKDYLGRVG